uniref:glycoside hydrolase family 127 protein n=1 Tax=Eisenbergiella sp. TaxID=1924109 RepID=UPI003AB12D3A
MLTDTRKSPNARLQGLPFSDVEWTHGLYKERFDTCAGSTVPHLQNMFERREISHVLENFRIAAGDVDGDFDGTVFGDGDFYKWMEAAVYTAVRTNNRELLAQLEDYIALIGRAQQPDGYISTKQIIGERSGKASRLGDINDFEVYNFGHLFTSACLYKRLTGKDSFLEIAEKAAEYLNRLYAEAEEKGEVQTAVCPSHYMGLAELYRTTGNPEYLTLLKKAVMLRDSVKEGMDDNQDRLMLKAHDKIIGHAVRANYLYAGVADLCLEEEDPELMEVLHKVWRSLVTQKLYITGGCGALYNGASPYGNFFGHQLVHQAYGYEYQLPNVTAYNETCASIGGVYWAWRMFCLEKKTEYADVLERMLLNVNLAAVSMDGKRFFYENMLRRAKKLPYELIWGQERAEYILSYCCPPNLARLMAQMSEYAYALDESGVYTVLYGASRARIKLPGRGEEAFILIQETEYPYDGAVRFTFEKEREQQRELNGFALHLRIPAWVRSAKLRLGNRTNGREISLQTLQREDAGTYLTVWVDKPQETEVLLELGMEARLTCAHSLVEETVNQVAVERGPLVYCMEGMDAPVETIDDLFIPSDISLQPELFEIGGRTVTALTGTFLKKRTDGKDGYDRQALYQDYVDRGYEKIKGRMIPYFAWDNRGMDEMRIWMSVTDVRSL